MTFSLVAACRHTGQVGVAAMTAMAGVGKLVTHAQARTGAAATQAMVNPYLALDGLRMLADGAAPEEALAELIEADPGREGRQVGLVAADGRAASYTGSLPADWRGHRTGPFYACQGNRLAGPEVLDAAVASFLEDDERPLIDRLMAALDAGEDQGGDVEGHRSAGITVMDTEEYPLWDLRIDGADEPLAELHRMYRVFAQEVLPNVALLPTRDDPLGGYDYEGAEGAV